MDFLMIMTKQCFEKFQNQKIKKIKQKQSSRGNFPLIFFPFAIDFFSTRLCFVIKNKQKYVTC
eukprot:m.207306 g.207306  ORF g.207306 m.207306 type:complete len:63 (+) comp32980_c1_seq2:3838-4026(+)